ncbi:MAG: glycoside hydrolase family 2 TIM barrel-domain containing protein [Cellulosilyticaceae bacterium]
MLRERIKITTAQFTKDEQSGNWEQVSIPHSWNNLDGQNGGNNYDRGCFTYKITLPKATASKRQFVEFEGANHITTVFYKGTTIGSHEGGFSTFRFELTDIISKEEENEILVTVDNRESHVYPQQADFTFFGGIYRGVNFIEVEESHFSLLLHGSEGVFVTPSVEGALRVDAFIEQADQTTVCLSVWDQAGQKVVEAQAEGNVHTVIESVVQQPHLWNGLEDPYCYTARLELVKAGQTVDTLEVQFGFRSFKVCPETGFYLNEQPYHLHGVSRHQDKLDKGWAISKEDQDEDLALIREIGANTIRLAHYQHDQYFYDLCDQEGMVLWAEIPFISVFIKGEAAKNNTISQMKELIAQNYNHPSIMFWGISNEITIGGEPDGLYENLQELNELTKRLDPSRLTTMAQVAMVQEASLHNQLTDTVGYNHYFGWYSGDVSTNGTWLDNFHKNYPDRPLGLSEYGCEGILTWHSSAPKVKDYTEEYQAYYHEEMLKTFATRPYIWATYVWNMFDFAADARDEGGCQGRNNKGLMTYDRQVKKDSYFIYKAYWTTQPFVHICGRRFLDRAPGQRDIKVYANVSPVTLSVNGQEVATLEADKIFIFKDVPLNIGENTITVKAKDCEESIVLNGTEKANESYVLVQEESSQSGVKNWFEDIAEEQEIEFREGYFSIKDTVKDLMVHEEAGEIVKELFKKFAQAGGKGKNLESNMQMIENMSFEQIFMFAGNKIPKGVDAHLNSQLIKIKK